MQLLWAPARKPPPCTRSSRTAGEQLFQTDLLSALLLCHCWLILLTKIFRCMMDAKLTNSRSRFMSRIQKNKLQFQIEAFRFKQDSNGMVSPLSPQCISSVIEEQTGVIANKIRPKCLFGVFHLLCCGHFLHFFSVCQDQTRVKT